MDGGLQHCTRGSNWNHPNEKEMQKAKLFSEEALQVVEERKKWNSREKAKDIPNWMQSCRNSKKRQEVLQFSSLHPLSNVSLWPHEPQHCRPPCPSPTARVHPNPCPLSRWCHPTVSSSVIPFSPFNLSISPFSIFLSIRGYSNESALHIRWPKYWNFSFNINPSKEHPGLIYFRMDWLDLLVLQGILKNLLQHHSLKASVLWHSAFL